MNKYSFFNLSRSGESNRKRTEEGSARGGVGALGLKTSLRASLPFQSPSTSKPPLSGSNKESITRKIIQTLSRSGIEFETNGRRVLE